MAFVTHQCLCSYLLAISLPILLGQKCLVEEVIREEVRSALENITEQIRCLKDQIDYLNSTTSGTILHVELVGVWSWLESSSFPRYGRPISAASSPNSLALLRTMTTVLELNSLFLEGLTDECVDEQLAMLYLCRCFL